MFEINHVYWRYSNNSYMRPEGDCTVEAICDKFKYHSYNIKADYKRLVRRFDHTFAGYKPVISLSGGIDSEVCAETFYNLNIPFSCVTLSLFGDKNAIDLNRARTYCADRKIQHKIIPISMNEMKERTKKAVMFGQFNASPSQVCLTKLLDEQAEDEILIGCGHNPDVHPTLGLGWWEDSPNMIKYAINRDKNFFSFTSLEPIFCHYAMNVDTTKPGNKNDEFIYKDYPQLRKRIKMTGWEACISEELAITHYIKKLNNVDSLFITWRNNE
jgi:hypothetical protein